VVKTSDDAGHKVFINMCASSRVAPPGGWTVGQVPDSVKSALANVDALTEEEAQVGLRPGLAWPGLACCGGCCGIWAAAWLGFWRHAGRPPPPPSLQPPQ
jgi:hypothetical protein